VKLVIIAGGRGTRLGVRDIPKPMVELHGTPILERQVLLAKRYGLTDITILSSHLSEVIIDYFGDGSKWGVSITHVVEDTPLGTAGAVKQLESVLTDRFMVFYGDTIMDIDLQRFMEFDARNADSIGSILVHPNDHPYDSDLLEMDASARVTSFYSKPHTPGVFRQNLVNAALYILSPDIFEFIPSATSTDFGKNIFPSVVPVRNLYAYKTTEYIKDMGTTDRLAKIGNDVQSGKVARRNLSNPQRAIFLDRDGVINEDVDNLRDIDSFVLLDGVAEAIKQINSSEYLCIVVTNQPALAKGFLSVADLDEIHKKMDTLLGAKGAFIDALYYCPHHPETGFEGEVAELKIPCDCRKPKNGMLVRAAVEHNIDLSASWMIGDRSADVEAGHSSGCKTILLRTSDSRHRDEVLTAQPDHVCDNLLEATLLVQQEVFRDDHH